MSSLVKIGVTQRKIGKRFPFSAPPNQALQLTASSVRSYVAPASSRT